MRRRILFQTICLLFFAAQAYPAGSAVQDAFSPEQGATALVVKTIEQAKESIHVAAYTFTSQPIADALIKAHTEGCDVAVVLDKSQRKGRGSLFLYLKTHGIPTHINDHYRILHDKFMIIDSKVLETGSFNYTKSAERNNAENVLVVRRNHKVINDYMMQWQKLWDEGTEE